MMTVNFKKDRRGAAANQTLFWVVFGVIVLGFVVLLLTGALDKGVQPKAAEPTKTFDQNCVTNTCMPICMRGPGADEATCRNGCETSYCAIYKVPTAPTLNTPTTCIKKCTSNVVFDKPTSCDSYDKTAEACDGKPDGFGNTCAFTSSCPTGDCGDEIPMPDGSVNPVSGGAPSFSPSTSNGVANNPSTSSFNNPNFVNPDYSNLPFYNTQMYPDANFKPATRTDFPGSSSSSCAEAHCPGLSGDSLTACLSVKCY